MKVDRIIPCVCCDHEPDCGDSVYYGMPQLKVCGGKPHTYFEVYCPNCGRKLIDIGFDIETATAFLNEVADADVEENKECRKCIYVDKHATEYPCSYCRNCYTDKFQPNDTYSPGKGGKR